MGRMGCAVWLLTMSTLITGCGAAVDGSLSSEDTSQAAEALSASLPSNVTNVKSVESVTVDDCVYTVGTATQAPPYPPVYLAWVQMSSAPGKTCPATGYSVVGQSYGDTPMVAIARHPSCRKIVVNYTARLTPSGSAHSRLRIRQISADDASIVRSTDLVAQPEGNVYSGDPHIDSAGNLFVLGKFNGQIPGMIGTGTQYVAYYQAFVFETSPEPAPNAVLAF
jgi:hypothetical protein